MKKLILPFALITLLTYSCKKEQELSPVTNPSTVNQLPTIDQLEHLNDVEVEQLTVEQLLSELAEFNTTNQQEANRSRRVKKVYVCLTLRNGRVLILSLPARLVKYFKRWGATVLDEDRDGYTDANACYGSKDDCNDLNDSIKPGMTEICGNNIDDNCDGQIDENCKPAGPLLGGAYEGGTVFYLDASGQHGLVVTNSDLPAGDWDLAISSVTNLTQNGYSDWYLPNRFHNSYIQIKAI